MKLTNTISILAFAVVLAACGSSDKKAELATLKTEYAAMQKKIQGLEAELAKEGKDSTAVRMKDVGVTELAPKKFEYYVQTQGTIESEENIQISAKSAGNITKVYVREGDVVSNGQTIAQIDNSLIIRGIDELKASLELATTVYDKQKNLWDQKIGTEVQYLQAKNNKEGLERRLASMNEQNEMTKIKSPINGIVDEVQVKAGQNIAPGMPTARVVNSLDLKMTANVSEAYVTNIKKGNKVIVYLPDLKRELEAKISFVGRNINQLSRTFNIEVDLPSNPDLRPNMTAIVKIVYDSYPTALVVPINVVQDINGEKIVYIAEANGNQLVARRKVITIDGVYDNKAKVNGLTAGDKVITAGFQGLNDGQFIKI
ncbi:MAG TPA: efflux RND transporter periplasmic adaptor subunit [Cyclobacteriaceae bacterium]|nr:efflux RND transporter periplasmic adaptor subunit [Cyclobacteriaceae bacterium]